MKSSQRIYLHIPGLKRDLLSMQEEIMYLEDFLTEMDLWSEFAYFRKKARLEESPDEPFSRYTID